MRMVLAFAAGTLAAAAPVWAQPNLLTGPRTLMPAHVSCTDVPAFAPPTPTLFIKGGHNADGHQSLVKGEQVVIKRVLDDGMQVGQRYSVRRLLGGLNRFPKEGEGFGKVHIAGWVTVTAVDEINALAMIDHSCDGIQSGDFLEPHLDLVFPVAADPMVAPLFDDRANILFGADGRVTFGDGDVISIDRGTVHGVAPGARFAIYRDLKDGLPLFYVGDAVVLAQGELTSKLIIVRAKDAVRDGDVVVPRRAQ